MSKKIFTDASVKALKPPRDKKQVEHFDSNYPGLSLRISYGGRKSWSMFYRLDGKLHRMGLGVYPAVSLADARQAWRKAREAVAAGGSPEPELPVASAAPTAFSVVAHEWLQRDQAKNRSVIAVTRIVNRELIAAWGDRPIEKIGRRDVLDLIDSIADRGAVAMARRCRSSMHRLFRWAIGRGIIEKDPMIGIPTPGKATVRDRVLTDEELVAVWNGAERLGFPFGAAYQLLILTGARREEIGRLRWDEILDGIIHLKGDRTKNGEAHDIPLSLPAQVLLDSLPRIDGSDFVFTLSGRKPVKDWSVPKKRLDGLVKIPAWRTHDLRRSAATGLQRLKVPITVTEAILGHVAGSRGGIVKVYQQHQYSEEKCAALRAWGAHVMALIEGRKPGKVLPLRA